MIEGQRLIKTKEYEIKAIIRVLDFSNTFEIIMPFQSADSIRTMDDLFAKKYKQISFNDKNGVLFVIHNCFCHKKIIKGLKYVIVRGAFESLTLGDWMATDGCICFRFDGLEDVIDFSNKVKNNNNIVSYTELNNSYYITYSVMNTEFCHRLAILRKIREYFEYIVGTEVFLDNVKFLPKDYDLSKENNIDTILFDIELNRVNRSAKPYHVCKLAFDNICCGIQNWLQFYEKYNEVISLWRKTIRNEYCSEEDKFIWFCQGFELLCTLVEKYKRDASILVTNNGGRSRDPNLKEFLLVVNNDIHFINCDVKEFDTVKHARNVFTHYNPEKHITEGEWKNAYHIIKRAFFSFFDNEVGLKRAVDEFFFVIPDGMMSRRIR